MGHVPAAGPAGRESDRRGRARGLRRGMGRHAAGARACGGCRCWTLTPGGMRTTTPARTSRRRPTGCAGVRESVGALVMDQKKTGERNVQKMRTKLLRGDDDGILLLFYPATIDEYGRALAALERPGGAAGRRDPDAGLEPNRRGYGGYVVTTGAQRDRWGLPDLAASGRVRVADEGRRWACCARDLAGRRPWTNRPSRPRRRRVAAGPPGRHSRRCARWSRPARASSRWSGPSTRRDCPTRSRSRCGAHSGGHSRRRPRRSRRCWTGRGWSCRCRGARATRRGSTRRICSRRSTVPTSVSSR